MTAVTATETLLRHERRIILAGLAAVCALAWAYLFSGAGTGMSLLDPMSWRLPSSTAAMHPGGSMARGAGWSIGYWLIMLAMWWVMMVAMMVPSAAPTILLYARVYRQAQRSGRIAGQMVPTAGFALGYLLAWLGFSVVATALQAGLERLGLMQAMAMSSASIGLSAGLLLAAGAYQLSPLKAACLDHCRSPVDFIVAHWRSGTAGALRMGLRHGAFCVGCCWGAMALLFVGGVMNVLWIAGLTVLVLAEKLAPLGRWFGNVAGAAMVLAGAGLLLTRFA